ncbi:MAG TPA: DUF2892 domain-containing protein [Spirochaetia bacterium]|nr:DUF2892 domain-containing protein [Spirochaetia bacterium]
MKSNMALIDRIIRAVLAVAVLVLFLAGQLSGVAAIILGIIAVIFIATAVVGTCPLYLLLRISTKKA